MVLHLNRRQWIKASAMSLAGLTVGSSLSCSSQNTEIAGTTQTNKPVILRSNESPYGISQKTQEAMIESLDFSHRYPHKHYSELIELIAAKEGLSPEHIVLGGGSTEIMTTLIHLYGSGKQGLAADPTYFDFVDYAEKGNCRLKFIPLDENYEHDLDSITKSINDQIGLVYICNPNNPTGTIKSMFELRDFCEKTSRKTPVIVDEAYHEYVEANDYSSMKYLIREGLNVIVLRTFSKIFGLAGLRVGYGMAKPETIKEIKKIQRNFAPIAYPSLRAAIAAYQDTSFLNYVFRKNREVKKFLYERLKFLGFDYINSHTNFVLFQINRNSRDMAKDFEARNVLIRPFAFKGKNWIRVSLGTIQEIKTFISVLENEILLSERAS